MSKQLRLYHIVVILCLSGFAFSSYSIAQEKDGLLKIYFLDVGQGDAIFIETPSGNQVLVDGGPDKAVLQKLGETMPFYDKNIDLVIMTHSDADHAAGLIEVLGTYEVKNVIYSNIVRKSALYNAWREAVTEEGANIIDPVAGKVIDLGNSVTLTVIHPAESLSGKVMPARGGSASGGEKTNNES